MKRLGPTLIALLLIGHPAAAEPTWSTISFAATASNAPQVLAAADKFMSSELGKTFTGKLLLQANTADGTNPATHTFVPIYKTFAERETFVQSLQGNPAWTEFLGTLEKTTTPGGTVLYNVVKSWGDINDTDHVWIAHSFTVSDPAAFLAAIEKFLASPTGQRFPGQVYLSAVVAGGLTPVTHVISVGYDSEAEMAAWLQTRNASADWAAYQDASDPAADYLGASMARDLKSWGPATLKDLSTP